MSVLIARRVIFAAVFKSLKIANYEYIDWDFVIEFLGLGKENRGAFWEFLSSCGAHWGSIYNKNTLLLEEETWLKKVGFYLKEVKFRAEDSINRG